MTSQIVGVRWIAPPSSGVHPRFALVKHSEQLFSYSQLLRFTPIEDIVASLEAGAATPQDWWNDLVTRSPDVARTAVAMCDPLDFEVLDLFAMEAMGTA